MNVMCLGCTVGLLLGVLTTLESAAQEIPACRMDDALATVVERAVVRVVDVYRNLGQKLPFKSFAINSKTPASAGDLAIYLIKDAAQGHVDEQGCISSDSAKGKPLWDGPCVPTRLSACTTTQMTEMRARAEQINRFGQAGACYLTNPQACNEAELDALFASARMDTLNARGGCEVTRKDGLATLRCSAAAIKILLTEHAQSETPTAALLFVLAHELYHLVQGQESAYSSEDRMLELALPAAEKAQRLRWLCQRAPTLGQMEDEADRAALKVLQQLWPTLQKELPASSSRSYHVDQIGYAATYLSQYLRFWQEDAQTIVHPVLRPASISTDTEEERAIARRARVFYCDALRPGRGNLLLPMHQGNHAALATRMQRISSQLAARMIYQGADPFQNLQTQISSILADVDSAVHRYEAQMQRGLCALPAEQSSCTTFDNDEEQPDTPMNTMLHAAARLGDVSFMQQLLHAGFDVDVRNAKGSTPLFFALLHQRVDAVRLLLDAGADLEVVNASGLRPLCLSAGATVRISDESDAFAQMGDPQVADQLGIMLLDRGATATIECTLPLMHAAVRAGQFKTLQRLLDLKLDPNQREQNTGTTPVVVALLGNNTKAVELLLEGGANPNLVYVAGNTALHWAALLGQSCNIRLLLAKGADAKLRNEEGKTPLDIACEERKQQAIQILTNARAPRTLAKCDAIAGSSGPILGIDECQQ